MLDLAQIESFFPAPLRPFKRNMLREYLQYKILDLIFHSKSAGALVFMGGTAVHLLHGSNRFSEDLDFDNRGVDVEVFSDLGNAISRMLTLHGYDVDVKIVIKTAFHLHIRFKGLLYEQGISPHHDEVLTIKVDTEPQTWPATPDKPILNRFDVFTRIAVLPATTLLAQKIACILTRPRIMGRDIYDAIFLMGKTAPDMAYLADKNGIVDGHDLGEKLSARIREIDFDRCAKEVAPFLFYEGDAEQVKAFPDLAAARFGN